METDQENSDQATAISSTTTTTTTTTTTDEHDQNKSGGDGSASQQVIRSYECTFCKRGFSNAQALGGHMNIHRKDKTKLKQTTTTTTTTTTTPPPPFYSPANSPPIPETMKSRDQEKSAKKRPWIFTPGEGDQGDDDASSRLQLPLFANETAAAARNEDQEGPATGLETLDLELRLGHEPRDQGSSAAEYTAGLKKFL